MTEPDYTAIAAALLGHQPDHDHDAKRVRQIFERHARPAAIDQPDQDARTEPPPE